MNARKPMVAAGIVGGLALLSHNPGGEQSQQQISGTDPVFQVAVCGKGVGDSKPLDSEDKNVSVGWDLWKGARLAEQELKSQQPSPALPLKWSLQPVDEGNDPDRAAAKAAEMRDQPRILAVIGHAFSSTTRAAEPFYAEAGIPLIIALATSPDAVNKTGGFRPANYFRLPPSDDLAQAPAVASFITSRNPSQITFIVGTKDTAQKYSETIAQGAAAILKKTLRKDPEIRSFKNANEAARHIRTDHKKEDIVIYCGYLDEGLDFLQAIVAQYPGATIKDAPTFVFTEGNPRIEEHSPAGLRVYRMSAFGSSSCTDPRLGNVDVLKRVTPEFIHGYDAVKTINLAVERCKNRVSRECVIAQLDSGAVFPGMCTAYTFQNGENLISDYFVLPSPAFTPRESELEISPIKLVRLRGLASQ